MKSKAGKRRYDVAGRQAAAAARRLAVVAAACTSFEEHGWIGTRIADVARCSGTSQKTIEAVFGTKAELLRAAVDYAIRGDIDPTEMPQREAVREMERASDAPTMLRLHARHLRLINARSARIAAVVEQAATSDPAVQALWRQMNDNRTHAVHWAAGTLLRKRGRRRGLTRRQAEPIFWVALDWNTYRTLTQQAGLDNDAYESWLADYYQATLIAKS